MNDGKEPRAPLRFHLAAPWIVLLCVGVGTATALSEPTPRNSVLLLLASAGLSLAMCGYSAVLRRRRPQVLPMDRGGRKMIVAPRSFILLGMTAWFLGLAVIPTVAWIVTVHDPGVLGGREVVVALAATGTLPDLVRLMSGRLHRWRLVFTPEALVYRGYRTERTIPWSKISRAHVDHKDFATIVVTTKGTREPDLRLPFFAFDLPAQQFVDEIQTRIDSARKRPLR